MQQLFDARVYRNVAHQRGLEGMYDYLTYSYINALKEKILNAALPDHNAEPTEKQKLYSSEDLKQEDIKSI